MKCNQICGWLFQTITTTILTTKTTEKYCFWFFSFSCRFRNCNCCSYCMHLRLVRGELGDGGVGCKFRILRIPSSFPFPYFFSFLEKASEKMVQKVSLCCYTKSLWQVVVSWETLKRQLVYLQQQPQSQPQQLQQ